MRQDSGSISICALAALSVAGLLYALSFLYTLSGIQIQKDEVLSRRSDGRAAYSILKRTQVDLSTLPPGLSCLDETGETDSYSRRICLVSGLIYDFDAQLADALVCSPREASSGGRTSSGFLLSENSSLWPTTCGIGGAVSFADLKVSANLDAPGELKASAGEAGRLAMIFAAGYIDLSGPLSVGSDLIVFAGGDLRVAALGTASAAPIRVTLISSTGAVVLDSLTGNVLLNTKSHLGDFLPPGVQAGENGVWPPVLGWMPLSLGKSAAD